MESDTRTETTFKKVPKRGEGGVRKGKNETLGRLLRLHATSQRGLPALNTDISHRREQPGSFLKAGSHAEEHTKRTGLIAQHLRNCPSRPPAVTCQCNVASFPLPPPQSGISCKPRKCTHSASPSRVLQGVPMASWSLSHLRAHFRW